MGMIRILEPRRSEAKGAVSPSPRLSRLEGMTIGILNNGWLSWVKMGSRLEAEIASRCGARFTTRWVTVAIGRATPSDMLARELEHCDAVINGFAN